MRYPLVGFAGLRHAIPLKQRQSDTVEEVCDGPVQGSAAGHRIFAVAAEHAHDRAIDQAVVHGVAHPQRGREPVALLLRVRPFACGGRGLGKDAPLHAGTRLLRGGVVHLLEDARHGQYEGRLELAEIRQNGLEVVGQPQLHVTGKAVQHHVPRECVSQRKEQQ